MSIKRKELREEQFAWVWKQRVWKSVARRGQRCREGVHPRCFGKECANGWKKRRWVVALCRGV